MPPLLVDLIHARACKPFCEKSLTLPGDALRYAILKIKLLKEKENQPPRSIGTRRLVSDLFKNVEENTEKDTRCLPDVV